MAAQRGLRVEQDRRRATGLVTPRTFLWLSAGAGGGVAAVFTWWALVSSWSGYRLGIVATVIGGLLALAGCLWSGLRATGPGRRWRLLFAAVVAGTTYGQIVWGWYIYADNLLIPRLTPVSGGFVVVSALGLAGLTAMPTQPPVRGALREAMTPFRWRLLAALDALLIASSLFVLAWATALGSIVDLGVSSGEQFAIAVAYPSSALVLVVFVLLMVVFRQPENPRSLLLIGLGLVALATSASAFVYLVVRNGQHLTPYAITGSLIGPPLIALGCVVPPRAPEVVEPAEARAGAHPDRQVRLTLWGTVWLPYLPLIGTIALLAAQYATGSTIHPGEVVFALVIVVLVVIRQVFTLVENSLLFARVHDAQRLLMRQARTDPLTGLANRMYFSDRLERAIGRGPERRERLALLFCDLDDFKHVNDTLGHHVGDEVLVALAGRIRGSVRSRGGEARDTVARFGGDEFAVLLEGGTADPAEVGARIVAELDRPFVVSGRSVHVRISVGLVVAEPDDEGLTAEVLMRRGDAAMYAAKRRGKGRLATHGAPVPGERWADSVLPDLEFALAGDRSAGVLEAYYQPVVSLRDGHTVAFEALARWTHPTRGAVPPSQFVPLAEDAGLVAALDSLILARACRDVAVMRAAGVGDPDLAVHVNVSAVWAADRALVDTVVAELERRDLPPSALVIEVTETYRITDMTAAAGVMTTLTRLGVGLALDDIGAGYSSVASLHILPFGMIKLDASLTGPGVPSKTVALRSGIVALAQALDLLVIAEGVETRAQAASMARLGCELAQGYLYAPAAPLERIIAEHARTPATTAAPRPA